MIAQSALVITLQACAWGIFLSAISLSVICDHENHQIWTLEQLISGIKLLVMVKNCLLFASKCLIAAKSDTNRSFLSATPINHTY